MNIYIKQVPNLTIPKQAKEDDAGYDIVATTEPIIVGKKISRPLDGLEVWERIQYIEYGTNLAIAPETQEKTVCVLGGDGGQDYDIERLKFHTLLFPRSSISKTNLVLANSIGLVDTGFRNFIKLRFKYIFQPEDLVFVPEASGPRIYGIVNMDSIYKMGDTLIQILASPNIPIQWVPTTELPASERGLGGFGSSDKK